MAVTAGVGGEVISAGSGGVAAMGGRPPEPGGAGGEGGGGGALPGLCATTSPLPPGCPCTSGSQCDGICLALSSELPCEQIARGLCFNPPFGGCHCAIDGGAGTLLCIEREVCPETHPEYQEACAVPGMACDYDAGAQERCWCMDRFGSMAWECSVDDAGCPHDQPTPGSGCADELSCWYVSVSSRSYRCDCVAQHWSCEAIVG